MKQEKTRYRIVETIAVGGSKRFSCERKTWLGWRWFDSSYDIDTAEQYINDHHRKRNPEPPVVVKEYEL